MTIDLVLSEFKDMLFFLHHFATWSTLCWRFICTAWICFPVLYKLESSANRSITESATVRGKSLINNKNSKGPKIERCGTPGGRFIKLRTKVRRNFVNSFAASFARSAYEVPTIKNVRTKFNKTTPCFIDCLAHTLSPTLTTCVLFSR